jgi:alpha-L-fucosidase
MKKIIAIALLAIFIFTTCARLTKEDWLLRYKELVERVQTEHMSFTENDWQKADEEFTKINNILKNSFGSELTNEDKITMHFYDMRYNFYRNTSGVIRKVTEYLENDFKNDVEDVFRQGKRLFSDIIDNIF